jgi:hypothetical protein
MLNADHLVTPLIVITLQSRQRQDEGHLYICHKLCGSPTILEPGTLAVYVSRAGQLVTPLIVITL